MRTPRDYGPLNAAHREALAKRELGEAGAEVTEREPSAGGPNQTSPMAVQPVQSAAAQPNELTPEERALAHESQRNAKVMEMRAQGAGQREVMGYSRAADNEYAESQRAANKVASSPDASGSSAATADPQKQKDLEIAEAAQHQAEQESEVELQDEEELEP